MMEKRIIALEAESLIKHEFWSSAHIALRCLWGLGDLEFIPGT